MGLKPGPKPIAKSTGKPDQRRRDNKKNSRKHSRLKAKQILDQVTLPQYRVSVSGTDSCFKTDHLFFPEFYQRRSQHTS